MSLVMLQGLPKLSRVAELLEARCAKRRPQETMGCPTQSTLVVTVGVLMM